jgi:hypothetical protein
VSEVVNPDPVGSLRWSGRILSVLVLLLITPSLFAQIQGDLVPRERTIPLREQVASELESDARRLGPIRIFPQFTLRELGYNDNVFGASEEEEKVEDYTATVGLGARYLMPFGRKVFLRGGFLPEYTYFHELKENRHFGGAYDARLLALFNRMQVEVGGAVTDRVDLASSESDEPVTSRIPTAEARLEIDVLPRVALWGGAIQREYEYDALEGAGETLASERLERTETAVRGGIRYRFRSFFDLSLGVEQTEAEFDDVESARGLQTEALLLGVFYNRPRLFVNLSGGSRKGTPLDEGRDQIPEYDTATGSYFVSFRAARPLELQLYGRRGTVFSLTAENPFFLESRNGAAVRIVGGRRAALRLFGDQGSNDYPLPVLVEGQPIERDDKATTAGAELTVRFFRNLALAVTLTQSEFDSNVPGLDRKVMRVTSNLVVRGDLFQ